RFGKGSKPASVTRNFHAGTIHTNPPPENRCGFASNLSRQGLCLTHRPAHSRAPSFAPTFFNAPPLFNPIQNVTTQNPKPSPFKSVSRRKFIHRAALGALFAGLPRTWVGSAFADDSPETTSLNFGMIALTDCSPIDIAHEKGLFKKFGINS